GRSTPRSAAGHCRPSAAPVTDWPPTVDRRPPAIPSAPPGGSAIPPAAGAQGSAAGVIADAGAAGTNPPAAGAASTDAEHGVAVEAADGSRGWAGRPAWWGPRRWWRSWSLRARLTVVATALLGTGLAVAAALLTTTVARSLGSALDAGAMQSAREIAALVDSGQL